MMRAMSVVVPALAALLCGPSVAHTQEPHFAAEIASGLIEIPLVDCDASGTSAPSWAVISDTTAASGTALEHARAISIEAPEALSICRSAPQENSELSLRFKALPGAHQGGGFAFRMATPQDYYLVKIDALRDRASLLLVKSGARRRRCGCNCRCVAHANGSSER